MAQLLSDMYCASFQPTPVRRSFCNASLVSINYVFFVASIGAITSAQAHTDAVNQLVQQRQHAPLVDALLHRAAADQQQQNATPYRIWYAVVCNVSIAI
jgi:hypothetical protein